MVMWTTNSGEKFQLELIKPVATAGYKIEMIGSVASKGASTHDLDFLLTPVREDFDIDTLWDWAESEGYSPYWTMGMETLEFHLPDGKVVDFFFAEEPEI